MNCKDKIKIRIRSGVCTIYKWSNICCKDWGKPRKNRIRSI